MLACWLCSWQWKPLWFVSPPHIWGTQTWESWPQNSLIWARGGGKKSWQERYIFYIWIKYLALMTVVCKMEWMSNWFSKKNKTDFQLILLEKSTYKIKLPRCFCLICQWWLWCDSLPQPGGTQTRDSRPQNINLIWAWRESGGGENRKTWACRYSFYRSGAALINLIALLALDLPLTMKIVVCQSSTYLRDMDMTLMATKQPHLGTGRGIKVYPCPRKEGNRQ